MSDALGYRGKKVVVSGCASGMGRATARLLMENGAEVHGLDFRPSDLDLVAFSEVDLRDAASIDRAAAAVGGGVSALFNCAGLPHTFPAGDVVRVNFIGTRHLTERLIAAMGPGSAIASIASTGGMGWSRRIALHMELMGTAGFDDAVAWCDARSETIAEGYAFSKEALIVWTQFMGPRLIRNGIRINCTLPSPTSTPMMTEFEKATPAAVLEAATAPSGRFSTPEEQAGGLVALNSALMSFVNGIVLPVDGGFMGGVSTGQIDLSRMSGR